MPRKPRPPEEMAKKLSPRGLLKEDDLAPAEKLFCFFYVRNGNNGSQALVASGYKHTQPDCAAYKLMRRPDIIKRIKIEQSNLEKEIRLDTLVTSRWVLSRLAHIAELTAPVIMPEGEYEIALVNPRTAVAALAEINKMLGFYAPEKVQNLNINVDLKSDFLDELIAKKEIGY